MEVREPTRDPEAFAGRFREIEDNIERVVRGKRGRSASPSWRCSPRAIC